MLKFLIGATLVFSLALAVFSVQFYKMFQEVKDLGPLRAENKAQKIQIQTFSGTIEDLKNQVVRLVEFDRKLRVMTDIGPPKGSMSTLGVGGSEEHKALQSGGSQEDLMQRELESLQSRVIEQEKSYQELEEVVQDRQSMWASTPSIWPTSGWLTSTFGKRVSPFSGRLQNHNGIDIAARPGTPIIAPASGVVSYSRFNGGFGRFLKINHGYGIVTHYAHLAKAAVKVGQKVKRGEVIAYVGNTGLSTGPHLHYEVSVNKVTIDPMRYILN
ncbi:MAG: M23 family metallopeptidase [Nitrospiria bacterium]